MNEYVFRDADGFGCDMEEPHESGNVTVGEYLAANNTDHYGTIHEPIVRCWNCKHMDHGLCGRPDGDGGYLLFAVEPRGFCAWAKRREMKQ